MCVNDEVALADCGTKISSMTQDNKVSEICDNLNLKSRESKFAQRVWQQWQKVWLHVIVTVLFFRIPPNFSKAFTSCRMYVATFISIISITNVYFSIDCQWSINRDRCHCRDQIEWIFCVYTQVNGRVIDYASMVLTSVSYRFGLKGPVFLVGRDGKTTVPLSLQSGNSEHGKYLLFHCMRWLRLKPIM